MILKHIDEKAVVESYSMIAKEYCNHQHTNPNPWLLIERPIFRKLIDNLKNERILDVGCGGGILLKELVSGNKFIKEAVGIDLSQEMLMLAQKNNKNRKIKLILANMKKIPFKDEYFNLIVSTNALDCVEDIEQVLRELFRVLKKDGGIIFSIRHPVRNSLYIKKAGGESYFENGWHKEKWTGTGNRFIYRFYRTFGEWVNVLVNNGFNIKIILEPHPEIKIAEKYPRFYKKHFSNPRTLMFLLEKKEK